MLLKDRICKRENSLNYHCNLYSTNAGDKVFRSEKLKVIEYTMWRLRVQAVVKWSELYVCYHLAKQLALVCLSRVSCGLYI